MWIHNGDSILLSLTYPSVVSPLPKSFVMVQGSMWGRYERLVGYVCDFTWLYIKHSHITVANLPIYGYLYWIARTGQLIIHIFIVQLELGSNYITAIGWLVDYTMLLYFVWKEELTRELCIVCNNLIKVE